MRDIGHAVRCDLRGLVLIYSQSLVSSLGGQALGYNWGKALVNAQGT